MHLHSQTWGHVSYATATPEALDLAEEENEIFMLRCRYGRTGFLRAHTALCRTLAQLHDIALNPNTHSDVSAIYHAYLDKPLS